MITIEEASEIYNVRPRTIRSWKYRKNLPVKKIGSTFYVDQNDIEKIVFKKFRLICKWCKNEFDTTNEKQIFCRKRCREKQWVHDNPERQSELQKESRLRKPVVCRNCGNDIPNDQRVGGKIYCDDCQNDVYDKQLNRNRIRRKAINDEFRKYKKDIGCQQCGYDKNGACLDFHHENTEEKERRITAMLWASDSDLFKAEIEKCVLLCKNCHYDVHNPEELEEIDQNGDVYDIQNPDE